ncbi:class 1 isoprenoid biosynthesis enzyme [Paenibacillus sp. ATY16]|uniref:class 1 isoprenoid biosynthesis enzyme n=1 Tax=Paenibacillus sp. ATY16 TaxID=1759312 RepID=UPI0013C2D1E3|nr:class 1 isoprenoid biosynthesis enzyme [Paenibacillus sp. ATY16]MCK9856976.1 class 1 isoprenoid biosynthesis enzyme [Paenibacillus sp. ATY16]
MTRNYLDSFKEELLEVFSEARVRINKFPSPFNQKGLVYLDKFDVFQKESAKNYICYLLPYWMNEITNITVEQCRKFSLANVFNMLYYFLQDDVMDETPIAWKEQLALAQLLHSEFEFILREMFEAASPFWNYRQKYVNEWAVTVVNENKEDYFMSDNLMIAKKASPLKLASTGALLLANQPEKIEEVEQLVDHSLVLLQLADDLADWKEDLQDNNYNCLLSMIKAIKKQEAPLEVLEVESYIYDRSILLDYTNSCHEHISFIANHTLQLKHLLHFSYSIYEDLYHFAKQVDETKTALLSGGFDYILSNNT